MSEVEKTIVLLKEELAKVERRAFENQMVDHWSNVNYDIDFECTEKICKLKAQIKELEDGLQSN